MLQIVELVPRLPSHGALVMVVAGEARLVVQQFITKTSQNRTQRAAIFKQGVTIVLNRCSELGFIIMQ